MRKGLLDYLFLNGSYVICQHRMVSWVFTVICRRHWGVIHWHSANAALAFCGGWGAGGARGSLSASQRLLLGDSAPPVSGLSFLIRTEGLRLGDGGWCQFLGTLLPSGHLGLLCEACPHEARLPAYKEIGKVPFICAISQSHT